MPTQIVQIGRHRFVSGLFWQSLSRRRELRKEALELARKLSFDLLIVRIERDQAEAGFANLAEGAQPGMLSLGTMVSSSIARQGAMYDGRQQSAPNWLGAFKVPDGRWAYFAVRDHLFLPNGDWVGTREEVFERLQTDYGLGGWNVVIGDAEVEDLEFHNFYQRSLDDLMLRRHGKPLIHRWWALKRTRRDPRVMLFAAAGAVLCCVAALAYVKYLDYQRAQAEARMTAAQRMLAEAAKRKARPVIDHPWAHAPSPSAFVASCLAHFGELAPGGWQLTQYECSDTAASYVWARQDSTVAFLLSQVPQAQIDGSGDRAVWRVPLSMSRGADDVLLTEDQMREHLFAAFQPLSIALKLEAAQRQSASLGKLPSSLAGVAQPTWRIWHFATHIEGFSPASVAPLLDLPGVRLDRVAYDNASWSIEGVVYAK